MSIASLRDARPRRRSTGDGGAAGEDAEQLPLEEDGVDELARPGGDAPRGEVGQVLQETVEGRGDRAGRDERGDDPGYDRGYDRDRPRDDRRDDDGCAHDRDRDRLRDVPNVRAVRRRRCLRGPGIRPCRHRRRR